MIAKISLNIIRYLQFDNNLWILFFFLFYIGLKLMFL